MTSFESFDPASLRRLDERALELRRFEFVLNLDDRREMVIDEMLRRGIDVIASEARRLGTSAGLSREQIVVAAEAASVMLQLRLSRPGTLRALSTEARELAAEAVEARAPEDQGPAELVHRRPDLRLVTPPLDVSDDAEAETKPGQPPRTVNERLTDALRRREIKPNDAELS